MATKQNSDKIPIEDVEEADATNTIETDESADEDFDRRQYGIYQVLPIDDKEPDWEAEEEPSTVEEYLRRVRYEARQLPSVVVSDINPRHFDDQQTTHPMLSHEPVDARHQHQQPSIEWLRHFLRLFSLLRRHVHHHQQQQEEETMPELKEIKGLDQVSIVRRLQKAILLATKGAPTPISPELAAQIYAFSVRIERPLHADTASLYRLLLRNCKEWLVASSPTAKGPPHIHVLVAIAGAYFKQDEHLAASAAALWDDEYDDDYDEQQQPQQEEGYYF